MITTIRAIYDGHAFYTDAPVDLAPNTEVDLTIQILSSANGEEHMPHHTITPKGVPGVDMLRFVGLFSPEDLEIMRQAADEDCEQIDPNEW